MQKGSQVMKRVRKTALLLAAMMLLSVFIVACTDKNDNNQKGNWSLGEGEGREFTPDDLPDDLNFNGYQLDILHRGADNLTLNECVGSEDPVENPLPQKVYERNLRVQTRLNCKLNWLPSGSGGLSETTSEMTQALLQLQWYDFILTTNNTIVSQGHNQLLCDLSYTKYINLEQPWWWNNVFEEMSYDGETINYICGDLNVTNIEKMSALYFNFDHVKNYLQMEPSDFYKLVDEKKWTIEKFMTLSNVWIDTNINPNGANAKDQDDIFSFPYVSGETINQFLLSTKIAENLYTRNDNGTVEFHLEQNEDIVRLVDLMRKLIHETTGAWNRTATPSPFDSGIIEEFANGNYIFLPQRLTAVSSTAMREMQTDFGILPYPLLDEGDEYVSDIQSSSTCICIPIIVEATDEDAFDRSCAVIEALGAEAYRRTTEVFYEMALKNRYTRDDDGRRMIDIIYNSANKSFLVEYSGQSNNIYGAMNTAVMNNNSVVPAFESGNNAAMNKLNDFIIRTKRSS